MVGKVRFEYPKAGYAIEAKANPHENIFLLREINDKTEHGNLGLYSVNWTDRHNIVGNGNTYYNLDLEPLGQYNKTYDINKKWKLFCKENGIKKRKNSWIGNQYPKPNAGMFDFFVWLINYENNE